MTTRATVIAHSISPAGKELITWETYYPWQIHGEVMTHRVFSRNASSNRAIPVAKMLEEVRDPARRAYPSFAVVNAPGMQGGRPTTKEERSRFKALWDEAAMECANRAEEMVMIGAAKQDANRLLMPFTHAHTLISATETDNFFGLRLDTMADPTMRALAVAMWEARKDSAPTLLQPGQWHVPFIDAETLTDIGRRHTKQDEATQEMIRVSVARCARVSYQEVETDKRSTLAADLALYDRLLAGSTKHASPAEHQATPDTISRAIYTQNGVRMEIPDEWDHESQHGNFCGWRQYRKMLPGEAVAPLPEEYI
jgi:thymidylate synthase ThyX